MHMLYHSDQFIVVRFDVPAETGTTAVEGQAVVMSRGGYEIVDRLHQREIYLDGALAEHFRAQVQILIEAQPTQEEVDEFLGGFTALAQQPVVLH